MAILKTKNGRAGILLTGLTLVLVPLLLNSILIVILNLSLSRAESLLESSRKQITVVSKLAHAIYAGTEILLGGNNAMINGAYAFFSPHLNRGWAIIGQDLAEVDKNITRDASYENFQRQFDRLLVRQQKIFSTCDNAAYKLDNVFVKMRRVNEWVRVGAAQSRLLHEQQQIVRDRYIKSIRAQQEEQNWTEMIVLVSLLMNALLAILSISLFQRKLSGRIEALAKMAKKLPLNQPIAETLTGDDELQDIGVELAKISWQLADVIEYRKSLMQMMAHDIRSPLMAADISIATLKKLLQDSLSNRGKEELNEAGIALSDCLNLVNDLLLMESLENGELKLDLKDCNLEEIISAALDEIEKPKDISLDLSLESVDLRVDPDRFKLVIERMIANSLERAKSSKRLEVKSSTKDGILNIQIRDFETPLSQLEGDAFFDKIAQASKNCDQSLNSLGLSVALPIMRLHGGKIGITPLTDGNLLWLDLPVFASEAIDKPR